MDVHIIPALKDNYIYAIINDENDCIVIDPGETAPVLDFVQTHNATLKYILNTHHHWDHTDGNGALKRKTGCTIIGPSYEPIPYSDQPLSEGDVWQWGGCDFHVLHTPGHTMGHIVYYSPQLNAVFTGDALFGMGAGRLFEGTPDDAVQGFQKLNTLPDDARVYFAHEYTVNNGIKALKIDPDNTAVKTRLNNEKTKRKQGRPTTPSTIGIEKQTNAFLMCDTSAAVADVIRKRARL